VLVGVIIIFLGISIMQIINRFMGVNKEEV
jgi:hypothetical protein